MIRDAIPEDLDQICNLGRNFVADTNLPYTFDLNRTRNFLWQAIHDDDYIILVDERKNIITGGIMGYTDRDFCVEYNAYIKILYVEREFTLFRGLIAMDLIRAFEERVKQASFIFTSATSGIDERTEKIVVNLFEKSGYSVLGRTLIKHREN